MHLAEVTGNFNLKGSKCYQKRSSCWSIKWYGNQYSFTKAWRPPPQCRHCLGDTNTKTVSKLREEHQFVIESALC